MSVLVRVITTMSAFVVLAGGCANDDGGGSKGEPIGIACTGSGDCASGFCVDGVCCDRACSGRCEACSIGSSKGTCTTVSGAPVAPRQACTSAGSGCGGTCDGTSSDCTYPKAGTLCGGSCAGTCNGAGTCSDPGTGSCPNGYACGSGKCLTSCNGDTDCQPYFTCDNAHTCQRVPESDCLDGKDNNGDGLADCQDPTCNNMAVECVPSVGNGATIGTVVASLPCPAGFGSSTPIYQNINSGSCSGCSCQTECTATVTYFGGPNCANGEPDKEIYSNGTNGVTTACVDNADFTAGSAEVTSLSRSGCLGSGTPTWAASNPAWANSQVFCGVTATSNTCGQNQICVPKQTGALSALVGSSTCPSGYVGSQATYYTSYTNGSCPACSSCKAGATVGCQIYGLGHWLTNDSTCTGADVVTSANTSGALVCNDFGATRTIYSTDAYWVVGGIGTPEDCKNDTTPTSPKPTGEQWVCDLK